MLKIYDNLYQFTTYVQPIDLTFHQYLINSEEPLLVHTGNISQAKELLPKLKEIIGDKEIKYIFVSHFESDECGGISVILKEYPHAKVICSEITARQLEGFGMVNNVVIKKAKDKIIIGDYEYVFISYPSEMHLWEGLLLVDNTRHILYSSDLMIRFGKINGELLERNLDDELSEITSEQIPDNNKRLKLINDLKKINIKFIATGHGKCIKII